jgi:hypothetical protein
MPETDRKPEPPFSGRKPWQPPRVIVSDISRQTDKPFHSVEATSVGPLSIPYGPS